MKTGGGNGLGTRLQNPSLSLHSCILQASKTGGGNGLGTRPLSPSDFAYCKHQKLEVGRPGNEATGDKMQS